MSYGTILLMALICFMLGGTERMPWVAVNESAGADFAPTERLQTENNSSAIRHR
ncbi:hypothetical protein [Paenibacillus thermotolerans]|uniref:hypothetical protein n=1 Tax=Paenibacillus thermotolerans TaxID=3027807 RepID=UPI00236744C7|nr:MULTISPECIES: hypothetical protein [unclassified Paenibacillus]